MPLASALGAMALCVAPVHYLGQPRGVLLMAYARSRQFDRAHVAMLSALGTRYARALYASHLYFAEGAARDHAERASREAEGARRTLAEVHEALERRVAERTEELERANGRLADEVAQRVRAEAERNALRAELVLAEEAERSRVARELHDQLGAHLTAFSLGLAEVRRLLARGDSPEAWLAQLEELSGMMARDTRYLALQLRPPELDDVGLESALRSYASQWSARYGIAVDADVFGAERPLPGDVETAIYRIVQEALTNVARHAEATQASVVLDKREREVLVVVEDDGQGFDADEPRTREAGGRRLGIPGMQERARLVGGVLEVESSPGHGTSLFVRIPLPESGATGVGVGSAEGHATAATPTVPV
jgi:signal transduction histidine kinase